MVNINPPNSSFLVDDIFAAKDFYGRTLGFEVEENDRGLIIHFPDGVKAFVYQKEKPERGRGKGLHFL